MTNKYKEEIIGYYKEGKYKYFVLKIEDLINSLPENDIEELWYILDCYNNYRKNTLGKGMNRYMVLNMDEFTKFSSFDEFHDWIKKKYEEDKTLQ